MRAVITMIGAALLAATLQAQQPAPPAAQAPTQPELPEALRLERENLLLTARINELETQLAALKAQLIGDRIGQRAPALIQRLQAAAPDWDLDPQTLEFRPKAAAAQGAQVPAPAATPPPPSSQPQQPRP